MRAYKILISIILIVFSLSYTLNLNLPCEGYAKECSPLLEEFNSDGQYRYAFLSDGETAEFITTFYAGSTYRIIGCTGPNSDTLIFKVLDANYNEIFSNADYDYTKYWDFKFKATNKYYIQAELVEGVQSGCAVILVGFSRGKK